MTVAVKNGLRGQILDESAKLFIEHGFNGTTINDIAASLGVTRTNIYYYFKDKREILEELTGDIFMTGRMIAKKAAEPRSDPVLALRELVEIFARVVLSNPVRYRVIERNEGYLGPELKIKVAAAKKKVFNDFRSVDSGRHRRRRVPARRCRQRRAGDYRNVQLGRLVVSPGPKAADRRLDPVFRGFRVERPRPGRRPAALAA